MEQCFKFTSKVMKATSYPENYKFKLSKWIKNCIIKNKDQIKLEDLNRAYPFFFNEECNKKADNLEFQTHLLELIIEKVMK